MREKPSFAPHWGWRVKEPFCGLWLAVVRPAWGDLTRERSQPTDDACAIPVQLRDLARHLHCTPSRQTAKEQLMIRFTLIGLTVALAACAGPDDRTRSMTAEVEVVDSDGDGSYDGVDLDGDGEADIQ